METEVIEVVANTDPTIVTLLNEYGFPVVMMVGLGYFIYYIWWFVGEKKKENERNAKDNNSNN